MKILLAYKFYYRRGGDCIYMLNLEQLLKDHGHEVAVVGNVKVGKHCVIGANSVVTKDIPDYSVAAGIPCKVIKRYDFEKEEWVKV